MESFIALEQVTVVCVTYCSRSIGAAIVQNLQPYSNLVIVDNASTDGTADFLQTALPHARVIKNPLNLGFGAANSIGIEAVNTPYALLLNPDTSFSVDSLRTLLQTFARYPNAAIVTPQAYTTNGQAIVSGGEAFYEYDNKGKPYIIPSATCACKWLQGCCLLVDVAKYKAIGGFDPSFFLYYEDDDLCLAAYAAGFECLVEPLAKVVHSEGKSSGSSVRVQYLKAFHYVRSRHLIQKKYLGSAVAMRYRIKVACAALPGMLLYALLLQRKNFLKWLARGAFAFGFPAPKG